MVQGNGLKIGFVVFFVIMSLYYLYPTAQNYFIERELASLDDEARNEYLDENYVNIQAVRENTLKLGLDLQGGMLVTLEVGLDRLVRDLAQDTDETFLSVIQEAQQSISSGNDSFIDAFAAAFEARDPNVRLSRYFRNDELGLTRRSTNSEVITYLKTQANDAVDRAVEIIRDRVDRFGVSEPSIQKQGTRRIVVELPGVDDPERVRKLLRGTARLEFHLMIEQNELLGALQQVIAHYDTSPSADTTATDSTDTAAMADGDTGEETAADSAAADSTFDVGDLIDDGDLADTSTNPLLEIFRPYGQGVTIGAAYAEDTVQVRQMLFGPETASLWPSDIALMWTANPVQTTPDGRAEFLALGVRKNIELTGDVITDAQAEFNQLDNLPQVTMVMNTEGAAIWSRLTGANVNKQIAIVLDNVVYSYPVVRGKISGGRSSIEGLDSFEEAKDIETVLKSGALPAPVDIVAEQTVGPSLGAASIRAGTLSTGLGLVLVIIFMVIYYRSGGIIADIALILNIVFIFGFLAGFNATLTLPGIAGIVLTIGMAVDANVLIFERIREEQSTGKTLKAAISGGYANALSAILDANITTFLVAAILFSFGKGPIQGFAVTLMAGILCSLFTAILVSRLIVDWMVMGRKMTPSFG